MNRFSGVAKSKRSRRTAVAAVELAVCLPTIVVIVFAAIEGCSMIYVTDALHAATSEGVRVAIRESADNSQVLSRTQQILDGHSLTGTTITLSPANVTTAVGGDLVSVTVRIDCDSNRISPSFFFGGRNIEVKTVMAKE